MNKNSKPCRFFKEKAGHKRIYQIEIVQDPYADSFFRMFYFEELTEEWKPIRSVYLLMPAFIISYLSTQIYKTEKFVIICGDDGRTRKSHYSNIVIGTPFLETKSFQKETFKEIGMRVTGELPLGEILSSWKTAEDIPFFKVDLSNVWELHLENPDLLISPDFASYRTGVLKSNSANNADTLNLANEILEEEWFISLRNKTLERTKITAKKCLLFEQTENLLLNKGSSPNNLEDSLTSKRVQDSEILCEIIKDKLSLSWKEYGVKESFIEQLGKIKHRLIEEESFYSYVRNSLILQYEGLSKNFLEVLLNTASSNWFDETAPFNETEFRNIVYEG